MIEEIRHKGKCAEYQKEVDLAVSKVRQAEQEVQRKLDELKRFINSCSHQWSKAIYKPRVTGGYSYEGDPVFVSQDRKKVKIYDQIIETDQE